MPFSLRSIVLFSSLIAASTLCWDSGAEPVVTPVPRLAAPPDDWAVPALLVPGGEGSTAAFPALRGSFAPLVFAGPDGGPLTPAPAEPVFGEPMALLPVLALPALPLLLPALAPPALPPLCASEMAGMVRIASTASAAVEVDLGIGFSFGILLCGSTTTSGRAFQSETISIGIPAKGRNSRRDVRLTGPVLDHAHEKMGFAVGTADLKPSHRNRAPAPDRIIDDIDDRFGLLLALHEFAVAP